MYTLNKTYVKQQGITLYLKTYCNRRTPKKPTLKSFTIISSRHGDQSSIH